MPTLTDVGAACDAYLQHFLKGMPAPDFDWQVTMKDYL